MESNNNSEIYNALVRIKNGEEINSYELERIDDLVYSYKFNKTNPGKSIIKLTFSDDEDYWKLFDLSNEDIWFANAVYSRYNSFQFENEDFATNDWNEGYMIQVFNNENLSKVSEILEFIAPMYSKLRNDDERMKASEILATMFEREIDEIKYEYVSEMNYCKNNSAKQMIESETCDAFQQYGIINRTCFTTYMTSVSLLLNLYKKVNDNSLSIYEVLKKIGNDINIGGNWYEYAYEIDCYDFDHENFDRNVNYQLEKIMDKITDDDNFIDKKHFVEKLIPILDKYDIDEWYVLPKDESKKFKILNIDLDSESIFVGLSSKPYTPSEPRRYNIEDFNMFLYQPELFEQKKIRKLK